tara:strand:- start:5927 stop:7567 length:1641 start_codon:yes stop_codon:yes gene_type:complete
MKTIIKIKKNKFWKIYSYQKSNFWVKGYFDSYSPLQVFKSLNEINISEIDTFIKSLKGHFAFVFKNEYFCIIVVDRVRSTPIFFSKLDQVIYISDHPDKIVKNKSFKKDLDKDAINEFLMSGYTIGIKTLFKNLNTLVAGEFLLLNKKSIKRIRYFKYYDSVYKKNKKELINDLSSVTLKIFKKLLSKIDNRQVVIPLSAGNDSRLVASILNFLNYKNVICYSYGRKNSFEVKTAERVSKKLGFKWFFVPLFNKQEISFYRSEEYKKYLFFSETYISIPYIQSLSTVKYLKEKNIINKNSIFINGNSGDFISGAHTDILKKNKDPNGNFFQRKNKILNSLIGKHFSLWGYLKTEDRIKYIKKELWSEINYFFDKKNKNKDYQPFEFSEFVNRQAKYVISGQRAYEFYGFEWRLPLWDDEYLNFWAKIPGNLKENQVLFKEMLLHNNFGGVWTKDFPVNKKNITPSWVIPLRFIAKIPFGLLGIRGKKIWHQFEINFFLYWMDSTLMIKKTEYKRMIKDFFKKPQGPESWQVEDYIKKIKNENTFSK